MSNVEPIFYAFALPENVVLVQGEHERSRQAPNATPHRLSSSSEREVHHHARHPRARCYDPHIVARLPNDIEKTTEALPIISEPTPLTLDIAPEQPAGKATPIPRVSVFLYVDGILVERYLVGYVPYQWVLDPSRMVPGEHLLTALVSWRDDHFGIAHVKVHVERTP